MELTLRRQDAVVGGYWLWGKDLGSAMKMIGIPETNRGAAMIQGFAVSQGAAMNRGVAAIQGVVKSKVASSRFVGFQDTD